MAEQVYLQHNEIFLSLRSTLVCSENRKKRENCYTFCTPVVPEVVPIDPPGVHINAKGVQGKLKLTWGSMNNIRGVCDKFTRSKV